MLLNQEESKGLLRILMWLILSLICIELRKISFSTYKRCPWDDKQFLSVIFSVVRYMNFFLSMCIYNKKYFAHMYLAYMHILYIYFYLLGPLWIIFIFVEHIIVKDREIWPCYSPWDHKESDMTYILNNNSSIFYILSIDYF